MRGFRGWTSASLTAALIVVAGGVLTTSAASSGASAFVPIAPCRIADTRPAPETVGTRTSPIGPGETWTIPTWGTNGNCTLPTGITGLSMNVTIIAPTGSSFLTVWPADKARPLAASLNWVAGQAPTPNAVTAALSPTGTLSFYNLAGTVNLAIDVVGYYEPTAGGPAGPTGPRGFSAWDVIPSGVTVTGEIVLDTSSTGATGSDLYAFDLPGIAPVALTDSTVNFAPDASPVTVDDDPTCTGTITAPTAPPGKLCIYSIGTPGGVSGVAGRAGFSLPTRAFIVRFLPTLPVAFDMYLYLTWAYTAP